MVKSKLWKSVKKNGTTIGLLVLVIGVVVAWGALTGWKFVGLAGAPAEEEAAAPTTVTINTVDRDGNKIIATLNVDCYNITGKTSDQIASLVYTDFSAFIDADTNTTAGYVFVPSASILYIATINKTGFQTEFVQIGVGINTVEMWESPDSVVILAYDDTGNTTVASSEIRDWTMNIWCLLDGVTNETSGYHAICDFRNTDYEHFGIVDTYAYINATFDAAPTETDLECSLSLGNKVSGNSTIVPLGSIEGHNTIDLKFGTRLATIKLLTLSLYFGNSTTRALLDSQ